MIKGRKGQYTYTGPVVFARPAGNLDGDIRQHVTAFERASSGFYQ